MKQILKQYRANKKLFGSTQSEPRIKSQIIDPNSKSIENNHSVFFNNNIIKKIQNDVLTKNPFYED